MKCCDSTTFIEIICFFRRADTIEQSKAEKAATEKYLKLSDNLSFDKQKKNIKLQDLS